MSIEPDRKALVGEDSRCLFLFAHPDDDVFISGSMSLLIRQGVEVHGVWVTSGQARGGAEMRERELYGACEIMGLETSKVTLLRFPNRGLLPLLDRAAESVAEVVSEIAPGRILTTAYEGGHIDHDAVNFVAYEARKRAGVGAALLEFPLYNRSGPLYRLGWRINAFPPGQERVQFTPLTEDAIEVKHRVMRVYASQWMDMIPFRLALSRVRLMRSGEPYRFCPPDRDHTTPPHPGRLNFEGWFFRHGHPSFHDFKEAVLRVRGHTG